MESKLIDCQLCYRCNELKVAYDKTQAAFNQLLQVAQSYAQIRAQLEIEATDDNRKCTLLRSRILLQQAIENVEKTVARTLKTSISNAKEDLEYGRVNNDLESQILMLNSISAFELVEEIETRCNLERALLAGSEELVPQLKLALNAVYSNIKV